jgi:regulator of RNase E activity RraA
VDPNGVFIVPAAEAVIVTAAAYATKKPEVKNTEKKRQSVRTDCFLL